MSTRPTPLETFTHIVSGITLKCQLEYEAGERETRSEPGFPSGAKLIHAYAEGGDDIASLLGEELEMEIEGAFLKQEQEA